MGVVTPRPGVPRLMSRELAIGTAMAADCRSLAAALFPGGHNGDRRAVVDRVARVRVAIMPSSA